MVCKPILPTSAKDLERPYDFPVQSVLNPISNYDRTQLRTVNILNNVLLKGYDLSEYPSIKNRFNLSVITDNEFAEFLLESGLDISFVQETFINDFPVPVDYSKIQQIVQQVSGENAFATTVQQGQTIGKVNPENIDHLLGLQEAFYQDSLYSQNENICTALTNPFAGIISVLATARDLAEGLKDIATDIQKGIQDIVAYGSLQNVINDLTNRAFTFQKQLTAYVDSFARQQVERIQAMSDNLSRLFNNDKTIPFGSYKFMRKKIDDLKKIYSAENLAGLKENLNKITTTNLNQFDDIVPDVLNFLLIVVCGLFDSVKRFLKNPADEVASLLVAFRSQQLILGGYSTEIRNEIKGVGGARPVISTRNALRSEGLETWARANPSSAIPSDITGTERALLDQINQDGLVGYFLFVEGRNVREMGKFSTERFNNNKSNPIHQKYYDPDENVHYDLGTNGGIVDAGWSKVNPTVWVKLIRAIKGIRADGFDTELVITSAYRSTYYNRLVVQGAKSSHHMSGEALDISFGNLSQDAGESLIRQCSINGFGGISFYPSSNFCHFDIAGTRTWGTNGIYTNIIQRHTLSA